MKYKKTSIFFNNFNFYKITGLLTAKSVSKTELIKVGFFFVMHAQAYLHHSYLQFTPITTRKRVNHFQ